MKGLGVGAAFPLNWSGFQIDLNLLSNALLIAS